MIRKLLMTLLLSSSLATAQAEEVLIDRIVALVNDDVVLASALTNEMQTVQRELAQRNVRMPPEDQLQRQVLERLILQTLQLNVAERRGIRVDSATLDAAVRRVADRNGLSLTAFRDALEAEGLDMAQFREQLRREIILSRLRQRVMRERVDVTDQEIDQFLERNRVGEPEYALSQILIGLPEAASADAIDTARSEAEAVLQRLQDGESFARVAAAVSDARNALEGGDLGWRAASELPDVVADALADLPVGAVTPILRTSAGFLIYELRDRRRTDERMIEQARLRHILIRTNAIVTDMDARLRLESLRERILAGSAFGDLARANSDDPTTATSGGELGWVNPANLPQSYREAISTLQPGELSEPFQTQTGWHLAEVMDRRERNAGASIAREEATEAIRQRKAEEETELWLRELREEAYVEIRLGGR